MEAPGLSGVRNQLKALRTGRGWSQAEVAARVDASRQTIIAVEADKYDPSLPLAFRLAALFGLPVETVFVNPYAGEGAADPASALTACAGSADMG